MLGARLGIVAPDDANLGCVPESGTTRDLSGMASWLNDELVRKDEYAATLPSLGSHDGFVGALAWVGMAQRVTSHAMAPDEDSSTWKASEGRVSPRDHAEWFATSAPDDAVVYIGFGGGEGSGASLARSLHFSFVRPNVNTSPAMLRSTQAGTHHSFRTHCHGPGDDSIAVDALRARGAAFAGQSRYQIFSFC